ncbi:MAG: hypothetical protein IJ532_04595 [Alphaproteobacteria bacterium]|nr:hypothetical protein [Alphaproteobacteria bacterium]
MIILSVISAMPMTPPPEPPIESTVSKEALAGKEIEIVEVDENGETYFPFVLLPQDPEVVVAKRVPTSNTVKRAKVHRPTTQVIPEKKVSASKYNRRGNRNH